MSYPGTGTDFISKAARVDLAYSLSVIDREHHHHIPKEFHSEHVDYHVDILVYPATGITRHRKFYQNWKNKNQPNPEVIPDS